MTQPTVTGLKGRLAERTRAYADSSIWADLVEMRAEHPDPVYFGDGSPAPETIPVQRMAQAAAHALEEGPGFLGYGETAGYQPLREHIATAMRGRGIAVGPEAIQVTAGSSQGLELACRVLLDPGDVVLVEAPTFLGALEIFETYQARIVGVPVDDQGMDIDALARALAAEPRAKMIYTIPTFHNPLGITLPIVRRQAMVDLARQHEVLILEDDPYWELQYDGEVVPPIRALDDDLVLHLGTFSKTIAPGIRMGWMVTPPSLRRYLLAAREVMDLHSDRLTMRTTYFTAHEFLDEHLVGAREIYRSRRDAMLDALQHELGGIDGATWSRPNGGFFLWITLPVSIDVRTFMHVAARTGVVFFPGNWFYHDHAATNVLRLSFSTVPEERIRLGIARLGEAVRATLAAGA